MAWCGRKVLWHRRAPIGQSARLGALHPAAPSVVTCHPGCAVTRQQPCEPPFSRRLGSKQERDVGETPPLPLGHQQPASGSVDVCRYTLAK